MRQRTTLKSAITNILGIFSNEDWNANDDGSEKSHSRLIYFLLICAVHKGFVFSALIFVSRKRLSVSPWS